MALKYTSLSIVFHLKKEAMFNRHQWTSASLNEELPIKMGREKFLRKCYFSIHGKYSSFHPRFIRKNVFSHLANTNLEIWVENSVSAIQHIENRKRLTELLPHSQINPFAYSLIFIYITHFIKMARLGGRCQNAQKQFIIKTIFAQSCR